MSEIYVKYIPATGFSRCNSKADLSGSVMSFTDFKEKCADIKPGSSDVYGIVMENTDVPEFIADFEDESIFTDAEKA